MLRYILIGAFVLTGFYCWHLLPNFATRDERIRVFKVLFWLGSVIETPTIETMQAGLQRGRAYGSTFYLYLLLFLPAVLVSIISGNTSVVTSFSHIRSEFRFFTTWSTTPEWFWFATTGVVRLSSVGFALGSVYLSYRIGRTIRDRTAGRLAAILTTLTFGFLTIAHEGGEDMPAVFFILLSLYVLLWYVKSGERSAFLAGCFTGGVALGFKFTAAPIVLVVLVAYLIRVREATDSNRALFQPGLILAGASIGLVTLLLSFPVLFASGPEALLQRITHGINRPTKSYGPDAAIWWWYLRTLFNGQGLVLSIASLTALVSLPLSLRQYRNESSTSLVVGSATIGFLVLFSNWDSFRVHHLLPAMVLLAIVLGVTLSRLLDRSARTGRVIVAVIVVASSIYAVSGTLGYAAQPRDQAANWLDTNMEDNESVEVYRTDWVDTGLPQGHSVSRPNGRSNSPHTVSCPTYIELNYRDLHHLNEDPYRGSSQRKARYLRMLLSGDGPYERVAEFGPRPRNFTPRSPDISSVRRLLLWGITPQVVQYGDEQDMHPDQYIVILERTAPCPSDWQHPYDVSTPRS